MKNWGLGKNIKYLIIAFVSIGLFGLTACGNSDIRGNIKTVESELMEQVDMLEADLDSQADDFAAAASVIEDYETKDEFFEELDDIRQDAAGYDHPVFDYCDQPIVNIVKATNRVICDFNFKQGIPDSDDRDVYLFEVATYEDESLEGKQPVARSYKNDEVVLSLPFETRHLFARFVPALLIEGSYVPIAEGQYITNPGEIARNTSDYVEAESKKGLLLDANTLNTEYLSELNVKNVVYNLPLSFIMGESPNDIYPTIKYEYNGNVYSFNAYQLAGFDILFKFLTDSGYHSTIIILNDWNKLYQQVIHPLSRNRNSKSMYYAFNTEEEEGVRMLEAAALFLADRYSGGEYGMVSDWVIANEVNQQKIWNYMATDDLEYYTESFEKSFRSFYNAIKSSYSNAHVYFSIDQMWNHNKGNNSRYFNGRDFMNVFNEYARRKGNYDWAVSIHPYPDPLTKVSFWNGSFDKTENAQVITPMNLSAITSFMCQEDFLDTNGNVRDIGITELGFTSKKGEKLHAAAVAYCYYIIEDNEYIKSFLLNRQTDDTEALKSGLALGIYNNDYSAKYVKDVFANLDTPNKDDYIPQMLEIIGAGSLEEALEWAR